MTHDNAGLEELAGHGNAAAYAFPVPMRKTRSCDFSFAGLKEAVRRKVLEECGGDSSLGWEDTARIMLQPQHASVRADIAAAFQAAVCKHLVTRTERAIMFATGMHEGGDGGGGGDRAGESGGGGGGNSAGSTTTTAASASSATPSATPSLGLISLSGGVACNTVLREAIRDAAEQHNLLLHCPPVELCVDNGVMIAWVRARSVHSKSIV